MRSPEDIRRETARIENIQRTLDATPEVMARQAVAESKGACPQCFDARFSKADGCKVCGYIGEGWPKPTALPEGLPPVDKFDPELFPEVLRDYVTDIADRMQCPVDFPAAALLSVLSAAVGRRCGIFPKRHDYWTCIPNLWGAIIGPPGVIKSPALVEVMRPLNVLQARAVEQHQRELAEFKAAGLVAGEAEKVAKDAIRKALKSRDTAGASELAERAIQDEQAEPVCRRYLVNDATVEKLGDLLSKNPHGLLLFRDELTGFFRTLERQGHEADRAFYLECWNGDGNFTYDRIGRGTVHIAGACLSVLGSIQPGPLAELVRGMRGSGDDGLLQRFQIAVWPDISTTWKNVDRIPDLRARDQITALIERLAVREVVEEIPVLHFADDAQELFDAWRADLERRLRSGEDHPAVEAHLAKYRSLIPSIALLLHLVESSSDGVSLAATERAIGWAEYLESHARRIYAPAVSGDMDAARLLADKITAGKISGTFSLRDVYRNGWTGLSKVEDSQAAVRVLAEFDWLREGREETQGRTATVYVVNPHITTTRKVVV